MTLELTDDEAALLLKELNDIIGGDRYSLSDPAPNPGNDPLQDQAPAAARPSTIAAEALRTAAGEFGEETRRRALMSGVRGIGSMAGANNSARPMPRFEPPGANDRLTVRDRPILTPRLD